MRFVVYLLLALFRGTFGALAIVIGGLLFESYINRPLEFGLQFYLDNIWLALIGILFACVTVYLSSLMKVLNR